MYKSSGVLLGAGELSGSRFHSNRLERLVGIADRWISDRPHPVGADHLLVWRHVGEFRAPLRLSPFLLAGDADQTTSLLVDGWILVAPGAEHLTTLGGVQLAASWRLVFKFLTAGKVLFTSRRTGVVVLVVADVPV